MSKENEIAALQRELKRANSQNTGLLGMLSKERRQHHKFTMAHHILNVKLYKIIDDPTSKHDPEQAQAFKAAAIHEFFKTVGYCDVNELIKLVPCLN